MAVTTPYVAPLIRGADGAARRPYPSPFSASLRLCGLTFRRQRRARSDGALPLRDFADAEEALGRIQDRVGER